MNISDAISRKRQKLISSSLVRLGLSVNPPIALESIDVPDFREHHFVPQSVSIASPRRFHMKTTILSALAVLTTLAIGLPATAADPTDVQRLLETKICAGCDLAGADLTGADLSGAHLLGADLRDANLKGAILTNANLEGADLTGANLTNANLTEAFASNAELDYANLKNANLANANLNHTNTVGAVLTGINLEGAQVFGSGISVGGD